MPMILFMIFSLCVFYMLYKLEIKNKYKKFSPLYIRLLVIYFLCTDAADFSEVKDMCVKCFETASASSSSSSGMNYNQKMNDAL